MFTLAEIENLLNKFNVNVVICVKNNRYTKYPKFITRLISSIAGLIIVLIVAYLINHNTTRLGFILSLSPIVLLLAVFLNQAFSITYRPYKITFDLVEKRVIVEKKALLSLGQKHYINVSTNSIIISYRNEYAYLRYVPTVGDIKIIEGLDPQNIDTLIRLFDGSGIKVLKEVNEIKTQTNATNINNKPSLYHSSILMENNNDIFKYYENAFLTFFLGLLAASSILYTLPVLFACIIGVPILLFMIYGIVHPGNFKAIRLVKNKDGLSFTSKFMFVSREMYLAKYNITIIENADEYDLRLESRDMSVLIMSHTRKDGLEALAEIIKKDS